MNFKLLLIFIVLLSTAKISAQFGRDEIKKSKTVKDEITLSINDKNNLDLYIDLQDRTEKTLKEKDYFQVKSNEFRVYANFVNPFEYIYKSSSKTLDDELFLASQEFLSTAASYIQEVQGASTRGKKKRPVANAPSKETLESELVEMYLIVTAQQGNFFTSNPNFWNAMAKLNLAEANDSISSRYEKAFSKLRAIQDVKNIKQTIDSNTTLLDGNKNFIDKVNENYTTLKVEFAKISFPASQVYLKTYIENVINELKNNISKLESVKKDVDSKYIKIKELFDIIHTNRHKLGLNKFLISKILEVNKSKRSEIKVTLDEVSYNNSEKSIKIENTKEFEINVRKKTTFIPVLSSGILYTNLSFPQFGTDTNEAGETVVTQTEDEDNEISIATYLNLYLNNSWDFPTFFQFGVGPSKEKPLLFLGGGVELAPRFTLSMGGVFTWLPKLNDLNVGDVVGGSSAIDNDLSFEFNTTPKFYFGLSIDLTNK
ncbi:hypothetical protein [Aquimarina algiphila]|uniref:hypothetical protein n=1 Tax=Aquimarina algiphila TaxID=2047982 RepID=UPI00249024F0|nr:hypothetical protein [Aquimarina algiphila]